MKPGTAEIISRFQLIAKRVNDAWARPVLLDGRLYLRPHDSLWCYGVRAQRTLTPHQ
ncbi:MAG: hypothetical protein JW955_14880 [Sedimentisphaerales bacterium]|nr:hypothetical protein [Sedimentisphaerales bacterium]